MGLTAFEDLCREWTLVQARVGQLSFLPEIVGSHWSKDAQVHYIFFARAGFTDAARAEAEAVGAQLVDLGTLDAGLRQAL